MKADKTHAEDRVFGQPELSKEPLAKGDYERCRFIRCDFAKADLSSITFTECVFEECDLSLARITRAAFRDVTFTGCKMLGLFFDSCNPFLFSITPENCALDSCSFNGMRLEGVRFINCALRGTDFSGADLRAAVFTDCELLNAVFDSTNLERADLRTAHNFVIDPEVNRLKGAHFSANSLGGLLSKHGIIIEP